MNISTASAESNRRNVPQHGALSYSLIYIRFQPQTQTYRLPGGYNPNQVAHQILQHRGQ